MSRCMVGSRSSLAFFVVTTLMCVSCGASSCLPAHKRQGEPDGRRPQTTRAAFERLEHLESDEVGRSAGRSQVLLLSNNTAAWVARWRLLHDASDSIDVTSYIVDDDVFGMAFLGHLYKKAVDGVRVRVLVDGRGSNAFLTPGFGAKDHLQELVHTGMVEVRIYNPPVKQMARALVELRTPSGSALAGTHNKILVTDHARAITGGRNIARHYYLPEQEERHGFFDADVLVTGAAVDGIQAAMDEDLLIHNREDIERDIVNIRSRRDDLLMVYGAMDAWLEGSVPKAPLEEAVLALEAAALSQLEGKLPERSVRDAVRPYFQELASLRSLHGSLSMPLGTAHNSDVRVIGAASLMQDNEDGPGEALVMAIRGAKKTIAIESPYFVLTPKTLEALEGAAQRGVAIDVITNSAMSTDNPLSASLLLDTWPELMARVPTMRMFVRDHRPTLHAKRAVFDDSLTLIGSYNLDPMSAYVNSETIVAVWSRSFNAQTRDEMERRLASNMLEYKIERDTDGAAKRYPRGHELAGHVIVEYGPRNHVPPEQVSSLVAQKDLVLGLKDLWDVPLVIY